MLKSASRSCCFDRFTLDVDDRRLRRDGEPVELSGRYFDALALLVQEAGTLVTKDRFMSEVWAGIPVTDEALTQCIKSLRRALADDASNPRLIETVPKHGYRFIAPVETSGAVPSVAVRRSWRDTLLLSAAGTVGGGLAGFIGGLIYGFAGASQPLQPGLGAVSILLVILCLTIAVALMGGAGVSFGIALSRRWGGPDWRWSTSGGAAGGLLIGAVVKLLGIDAFNLLFGRSPAGITGAMEGILIGGAVGFGAWLAWRGGDRLRRGMIVAGLIGSAAGVIIPLLGGRMMAGSLDLLSQTFPDSRLRLGKLGALVGEQGLGLISQMISGALEGGLFAACVVGATILADRTINSVSPRNE
ncbi:MAG: winged helix-turn-helix domain-containing protein [Sphingomonas sp.]|nr:winged helix-turn-helix domain-containing protein [Sphingomonas sp.]MBW0008154.1 winged helix-turn-helix domain-containing protein [Sphingomonas sp.]